MVGGKCWGEANSICRVHVLGQRRVCSADDNPDVQHGCCAVIPVVARRESSMDPAGGRD